MLDTDNPFCNERPFQSLEAGKRKNGVLGAFFEWRSGVERVIFPSPSHCLRNYYLSTAEKAITYHRGLCYEKSKDNWLEPQGVS